MFLVIRKIFFVLSISTLIIGGLFLFSQNSKSYNDKTTHPALTDEIVDFYNLSFDTKLTSEEKEWVVQGSIDEDTPPRWINHFYDPTTGDGWKAENLGEVSPLTLRLFSKIFFNVNTETVSSKNWVHNEILQLKYEDYGGNRTWENAIRRYANGDKEYAYKTLGHILHLLEDKTVPDHTRNDTHAHEGGDLTKDGGSPYEDYSSDWNRRNLNIAQDLKNNNKLPIILNSIDAYFDALANYSNQYFFSEHTIKSEKYRSPDINNLDEKEFNGVLIGYSRNDKFPLVKIKKSLLDAGDIFIEYSINEKYILENYFSRLSSFAVLNGAGAIKLFLEEVAKAEKDRSLIPEEPKISWWQKMRSPLYGVIIPTYNSGASIVNGIKNYFSTPQSPSPLATVANIGQVAQNNNQEIAASRTSDVGARNDNEDEDESQNDGRPTSIIPPDGGFPGGDDINDDIVVEIAAPRTSDVGARNDNEIVKEMTQEEIDALVLEVKEKYGLVDAQSNNNEKAKEMTQEEIDALVLEVKIKYGLLEGAQPIITIQSQPIAPLATAFAIATGIPDTNVGQTQNSQPQQETVPNQENQNQLTENNIQKPETPVITTNSGQDLIIQKFALQYPLRSISFILEGTKAIDISKIRINDAMDTVDSESINWRKEVVLLEGENIFAVATEDDAGNISDSATIRILLQFDNSTFYLTDYDVRKMNFTLNWGDDNNVIKEWELEYKLAPNFDWEILKQVQDDSEENSYQFTAKYDDLTYYFRLRGSDADGNQTDWMEKQAEISTKPIAINEIAWRGTEAHHSDEWIELANKTNQEIDLNGWTLKTTDGIINVKLTDKIAANGFYLLERTADTTISNITADQIYKGALTNKQYPNEPGQNLKLLDKDNIEIDNVWTFYAGDNNSERTSERINIWSPSAYKSNWMTYSSSENIEALDANGNPVFGTPRAKNSQANIYFSLNSGVFEGVPTINQDAIFLKNRGPYMANGSVGATNVEILIEPGASLEFNGFGMLGIYDGGELIAKGTENEKIIIKSSTSDRTVLYFSGAKGELENLEISGGGMATNNSTIKIANSAIKNARGLLTLQNSEFDISGSEFSGDNGDNWVGNPYYGEAILIKQSRGKIQNNAIKNNKAHGIYVESLSGALDILSNNFSGNSIAPIATNGFINIDADNLNLRDNVFGINDALTIYNPIVKEGEEVTISSQMPYFLYPQTKSVALYQIINPEIEKNGILKIEPGAIIEFDDEGFLKVYGELEAMGTLELPIIFRLYGDGASYENMVSNISGTLTPDELNEVDYVKFYDGLEEISNHIQFYDGSELALENVIIRRKFVDQYYNISYQSWLVNEP